MVVTVAHEGHIAPPSSVVLRPTYSVMLLAWLLLPTTVVVFLMTLGIERARHEFDDHVGQIYAQLAARLRSNESVLNGFASFLAVAGNSERDAISHYAMPILEQNPHIYALEVVDEVDAGKVGVFLHQMRAAGYPAIAIRTFDYTGTRSWQPVTRSDHYYPVSIIVSLHEGLDDLLGMDVSQVPLFSKPLHMSLQKEGPFASEPFVLYQGSKGYAMFRSVEPVTMDGSKPPSLCLAMLVVRVRDLLPAASLPQEYNFHVTIAARNNGADSRMTLLDLPSQPEGWLVTRLLPSLNYTKDIEGSTPRVSLTVERRLKWEDINLPLVTWVIAGAAITFALLQLYARAHRRSEMRRLELEELLHYRAHHDELTGLPNRSLIIDRIEQGMRNAQREGRPMALLFLDLDGFKPVNDRFGHDVGDLLLTAVGQRLCACTRAGDVVARLGGDEFAVLIESASGLDDGDSVAQRLDEAFAQPFSIKGQELRLGASVGRASFPGDADSAEGLLQLADRTMFEAKRNHATSRTEPTQAYH
jgi:diguanylate cyclase (GGDEF)-like protein